jgi:hypothetical protein
MEEFKMIQKALVLTILGSALCIGSAMADNQTSPPNNDRQTKFACEFQGQAKKEVLQCRAMGEFEKKQQAIAEDHEKNRMWIACDSTTVYRGDVKVKEKHDTLILKGDGFQAPFITVEDFEDHRNGHHDDAFDAKLVMFNNGAVITLPGECKFEKEHD